MQWIFAGFVLLALVDLPPLIIKRQKRTIVAFLVVFVIALTLGLLLGAGIQVPSILLLLGTLFKAVGLHY